MNSMRLMFNHVRDIRTYDDQGENHGYFETYTGTSPADYIWLRVNYVHGKETGYEEYYGAGKTTFYIT